MANSQASLSKLTPTIQSLQTKDGKFTSQPEKTNTGHPKFTDEGWQIHKPALTKAGPAV
jgi:hypothetical protein